MNSVSLSFFRKPSIVVFLAELLDAEILFNALSRALLQLSPFWGGTYL
jgi:hypothetical protein